MSKLLNAPAVVSVAMAVSITGLTAPQSIADATIVVWSIVASILALVGARRCKTSARSVFTLFATVASLISLGIIVRGIHGAFIGVDQPIPSPADFIHLPAYVLCVVAASRLFQHRAKKDDSGAWLDTAATIVALLIVASVSFLLEFGFDSSVDLGRRVIVLSYTFLVLSVFGIALRVGATPGNRPTSYYLLGGATAAFTVADLAGTFTDVHGGSASIAIALSPITFGLLLAAVWHPSVNDLIVPAEDADTSVGPFRIVVLGAALISPASILLVADLDHSGKRAILISLSILLAALILVRVVGLLRNQELSVQLDRLLVDEIRVLSGLDSDTAVAERLPTSLQSVLPSGALIQSHEKRVNAQLVHEVPQNLKKSSGNFLSIECGREIHAAHRQASESLIRDAGLIAASLEGIAATAKQDSEREANERLAASERRFRALVQNSNDVVIVMDEVGRVKFATESTERSLGYQVDELLDQPLSRILHEKDRPAAERFFFSVVDGAAHQRRYEFRGLTAEGEVRLYESVVTDMREVEGIEGFVLNAADVTDRRRLERDLKDAETIDPLTMQYNRKAFLDEIDIANRRASVTGDPIGVAIIDLDDFKTINDALGPVQADRALVEVAHRIRQSVGVNDVIARLSGDEFGVLLADIDSSMGAVAEVERILRELVAPMTISDFTIIAKATAGVFVDSSGLEDAIGFLKNADTALTVAKGTNRGSAVLFEDTMAEAVEQRLDLRTTLEIALETRGLRLAYQPIIDTFTGQIVSLEALARWTHPDRGEISPGVFIPIAESSGLISRLGDWALKTACKQVVAWDKAGYSFFTVSVNVSGHQLREDDYIQRVREILEATGVDPSRIIVEITESVLIDDTDFVANRIRSLRELGLALAIDDFGTGYSSLSYLQRYEFDYLKIDSGFVRPLGKDDDAQEREIVSAIVQLAQGLGAITVAEGIENVEEMTALEKLGCDRLQGFLFYRPIEVEAIEGALASSIDEAQAA